MKVSATALMSNQCLIREYRAKQEYVIENLKQIKSIVENLEGENKELALEMLDGCEYILDNK